MKHSLFLRLIFILFFGSEISGLTNPLNEDEGRIYSFSNDGTECIVHRDNLLRPWLNRLSNDVFFTWITHNGYIESFLLDPVNNGLVNPQTVSGHFYIKDQNSGNYFLVNESNGEDNWEAVIGLGYNKISKEDLDIKTTFTYFIPREENVLLVLVELENLTEELRDLSVYGQVEWNLGDATKKDAHPSDGLGGSQHNLYKKVYVEENTMYAEQTNWRSTANSEPWPYIGYFTTDKGINSYETNNGLFLGYRKDYKSPEALKNELLANTNFWNYDEFPLGVIEKKIEIPAGSKKKMVFMLGMERGKQSLEITKKKYSLIENTEKALKEVKDFYKNLISNSLNIETPDKDNDRIINIWSQYHWRQFFKKDLDTGSMGAGFWAYGLEGGNLMVHPELFLVGQDMGLLKNSLENILLVNQNPDLSKNVLFQAPPAMLDSDLGIAWPPQEIPNGHTSPHHHSIYVHLFSVYYYLLESGDFEYLNKELPYLDGTYGTVFEHVEKAIEITLKGLGERGLYKMGKDTGDWMDEFTKISKFGKAESPMLSAQVAYILKNFSELALLTGRDEVGEKWMGQYEKIKDAINLYAWDGDWYIRAFSDHNEEYQPIGSNQNEEGKIYLNSQSWMILSDVATPERAEMSLSSVEKYLLSDFGPLVFSPSYSSYVDYIGTQSIYSPGFRNGNIYFRPAGWAVIAAAMTNHVDLAHELYRRTSLSERSLDVSKYLLEPYAYPENYIGPDHFRMGEGQFHWCFGEGTGWMWYSYVGYILGVRAELDGLLIDPKIPRDWNGFKVTKPFRGAVYEIEVKNPDNVSNGIKWIKVDGKKIKGSKILPHHDDKVHHVEVLLGSSRE
jgi:cellobiose phosphorylase